MLTTHFLCNADVKNGWIYAFAPPSSFNSGFLVTFIYLVKVCEGNKEKNKQLSHDVNCVCVCVCVCLWWVGMEGWDNGLLKNAKNVNEINDEI